MKTSRGKILLAEDSALFRMMFSEVLKKEGFAITLAIDGKEALSKLERDDEKFDLLLLDIEMPNMNGIEVLEKLGSINKAAPPTLILTATSPSPAKLSKFRALGAKGYIVKDQPEEEIIFRIKSMTSKGEEKRKDLRDLLSIPLQYSMAGSYVEVKSFDFSNKGTYIATTNPCNVGEILTLRLKIPGQEEPLSIKGKVMFNLKMGANKRGSYPPGMGIQFMDLNLEEKKLLNDYIVNSKRRNR